jgi:hypothetical protein
VPKLVPEGRHWLYHSCRRWQLAPAGRVWPGKTPSTQVYWSQLPPLPPHWSHSFRVLPELEPLPEPELEPELEPGRHWLYWFWRWQVLPEGQA